ncbi:MAG TPA: tRNA (adenosine(37)-N6)-dimethylallyltransferase MiaA [Chitinophagaceae bacterium]|nr:tRNA (adenosine(37)-N6)-dimethylallyltransferase MiaA [Chitinophagaceae bacterium]
MNSPKQKTVIIICGPTAVGKTSVAILLAKHFHSEIISADSRQCFKELKIGVARPSDEELKEVPHHFIASHPIAIGSSIENINAAFFEKYALQIVNELFKNHDIVIMVGGTGLYIKAFCEGLDKIPATDESVRKRIIAGYESNGLEWLQDEVRKKDPAFYNTGEIQNPQRMMRALEVIESTGQSILSFRGNKKIKRDFRIIKIGLELPKEELHTNINLRVDKMINDGLVEEVRSLQGYRDVNALQTVGYSEIFEHLDEKMSLAAAIEEIKKNTRQYAKRQVTWFKKDKEIHWINARQKSEIVSMAQKLVQGD